MKLWLCMSAGVVALVICAAAFSGLFPKPLYGKRIAGVVVDADTGKPIARAHVAFVWDSAINPSGFTAHNSRDICYHAAATITDERGRFMVPAWKEWSTYNVDVHDPTALVYAPRYTPVQIPLAIGQLKPPKDRPSERYELRPFSGTVDERLNVMWWGVANHGCSYGGESQKSLFPMLKAMFDEAKRMAATREQKKQADAYAVMAANAAIAGDPNSPSNDAEIEQFIKENLE